MNNFSIALEWIKSTPTNKLIISNQFLKPFSEKQKKHLLQVISKTHYIWPIEDTKHGIVCINKKCSGLNITRKDGMIVGFIQNKDNITMLPITNYKWLKQ